MSTRNRPSGVWALACTYVLITDRWRVCVAMWFTHRNACCLVITLNVQRDKVNFAWGSVARSIGVSRHTCRFERNVTTICTTDSATTYAYLIDFLLCIWCDTEKYGSMLCAVRVRSWQRHVRQQWCAVGEMIELLTKHAIQLDVLVTDVYSIVSRSVDIHRCISSSFSRMCYATLVQ